MGEISTANELIEFFGDANDHGCNFLGIIDGTEETLLDPENDNQGRPTVEIIDCETTEIIYTNYTYE